MTLQLSDLKFRRRVLRIKSTLYVCIPTLFAEADNLAQGSYVEIRILADGSLRIEKETDIINDQDQDLVPKRSFSRQGARQEALERATNEGFH